MALQVGATGHSSSQVSNSNTALSMGSGSLEVFATPALISLMEAAAVDCLKSSMKDEETSVGTNINVSHIAATPIGVSVRAEAVVKAIEGRKIKFDVVAFDAKEKIGEGTHERFIVNKERFLKKVEDKKATT